VERVVDHLGGRPVPTPEPIADDVRALAEEGGVRVHTAPGDGPNMTVVTMVAPDSPGMLATMAGVLALAGLQAHSASVRTHAGSAVDSFVVMPTFGSAPDAQLLRQRLIAAVSGNLDVHETLAKRIADRKPPVAVGSAAVPTARTTPPPRVSWLRSPEKERQLLELRAQDDEGLLARVSAELDRCGVDVVWATVATMGATAVDTFCLVLPDDSPATRERVAAAVLSVCRG
jgi:[protein-PII] uridylyltransferase